MPAEQPCQTSPSPPLSPPSHGLSPHRSCGKTAAPLSSGGRVREYLLTKRISFNVHDAAGGEWLPASEISIRRSYTFNESEVLAREAQEQRLLKEMQTDAVQQIVRRLQAAKKPAG